MEPASPGLLISIREACKLLGIGRSNVYAELQKGRLNAKKLGRRTLIDLRDVQKWIEGLGQYPKRDNSDKLQGVPHTDLVNPPKQSE